MKGLPLSADHPDFLILFRKYVSRRAGGKGRAVLDGVGLSAETIEVCFRSHPFDGEEAVQEGLVRWINSTQPTWEVLIKAMEYAGIAPQHIQSLKATLSLHGAYAFVLVCCVCVCACGMCASAVLCFSHVVCLLYIYILLMMALVG